MSTLGVRREKDFFLQGYGELLRRIEPETVICYGATFPEMQGKVIEVGYAETNHLEHKRFWTVAWNGIPDKPASIERAAIPSEYGIYVFKTGGCVLTGYGGGGGSGRGRSEYKKPKPGNGKERATDIPSWAKGERPYKGENGDQFAKRLLDQRYGPGNYSTDTHTEYSRLKKHGDRGFL